MVLARDPSKPGIAYSDGDLRCSRRGPLVPGQAIAIATLLRPDEVAVLYCSFAIAQLADTPIALFGFLEKLTYDKGGRGIGDRTHRAANVYPSYALRRLLGRVLHQPRWRLERHMRRAWPCHPVRDRKPSALGRALVARARKRTVVPTVVPSFSGKGKSPKKVFILNDSGRGTRTPDPRIMICGF